MVFLPLLPPLLLLAFPVVHQNLVLLSALLLMYSYRCCFFPGFSVMARVSAVAAFPTAELSSATVFATFLASLLLVSLLLLASLLFLASLMLLTSLLLLANFCCVLESCC